MVRYEGTGGVEGNWTSRLTPWFLSWIYGGLITLKGNAGGGVSGIGEPKVQICVSKFAVHMVHVRSSLQARHFYYPPLLPLAVCWAILLWSDAWMLFPRCRQAALMKLSLYKPIALFPFGLFPKVRCIWGASPKDLRSQEMNEPFLWLLLHISRLSIERQFLQSATSNQ